MNVFKFAFLLSFMSINIWAQSYQTKELMVCSPPAGSQLYQIKIIRSAGKLFVIEKTLAGDSAPIEIYASEWEKKDIAWKSPAAGHIRIVQVPYGAMTYWAFKSTNPGVVINGYCLN